MIQRSINQTPDQISIQANEIKSSRVSWQSYLQSQVITKEDFNFIINFERLQGTYRANFINNNQYQCAKTFLYLIEHISKDQTVQYTLILIDEMLNEDHGRIDIFRDYCRIVEMSIWNPFMVQLDRQDGFILNMSCRIIAKITCWSSESMQDPELTKYLTSLQDQMHEPSNPYLQSVTKCLQMMLRIDRYRRAFDAINGISTLEKVLSTKLGFQLQYQLAFCCWVLTFNTELCRKMKGYKIIETLSDVLRDSSKVKVNRIILAVFRNLVQNVGDKEAARENAILMVQCKVMKQLEVIQQSLQMMTSDPELLDDLEFLRDFLHSSIQDLSSFDEYTNEVRCGRLEWSPVHTSKKFWHENAHRLNDKNYELLKTLIGLIETSNDPLITSVACHDIGEYVSHYTRGKLVIEGLGGKNLIMQKLTNDDPNVRYESLLCVQKMMVQNWEYLGRQIKEP